MISTLKLDSGACCNVFKSIKDSKMDEKNYRTKFLSKETIDSVPRFIVDIESPSKRCNPVAKYHLRSRWNATPSIVTASGGPKTLNDTCLHLGRLRWSKTIAWKWTLAMTKNRVVGDTSITIEHKLWHWQYIYQLISLESYDATKIMIYR